MNRFAAYVLAAAATLAVAGCGDQMLQPRGKLLKGGQPIPPAEGQSIRVTFVPIAPDGKPPADYYYAETDQATATFRPAGKDGRGLPPGKYRVAVEIMVKKKDALNGRFDPEKSPYVFDVSAKSGEIVIDLDKLP